MKKSNQNPIATKDICFDNLTYNNNNDFNIKLSNSEKDKNYGNRGINKKKRNRNESNINAENIAIEIKRRKITGNDDSSSDESIYEYEGDKYIQYPKPWILLPEKERNRYLRNDDADPSFHSHSEEALEYIEEMKKFHMKSIDKQYDLIEWIKKTIFYICNSGKSYFTCRSKTYDGDVFFEKLTIDKMRKQAMINTLRDEMVKKDRKDVPFWYWIKKYAVRKDFVVFDPTPKHLLKKSQKNVINLFTGFRHKFQDNFKVDQSKIKILKDHIKFILCRGNEQSYEYIIKWIARIIQFPHEKNSVALVFKSKQGSGKGLFVELVMNIIGFAYSAIISNMESLTGRFNSRLANKLITHLDEAQNFGGSRKINNIMKSILTQKIINIERKGMEVIAMKDFNNYIISTNEDFPMKVEELNRRVAAFLALSKNEKLFHDFTLRYSKYIIGYFDILAGKINDTETQIHFFHYLAQYDLRGFKTENIPETKFLKELRIRSAPPVLDFLRDLVDLLEERELNCNEKIDFNSQDQFAGLSSEKKWSDLNGLEVLDSKTKKIKIWTKDMWEIFTQWKLDNGVKTSMNKKQFILKLKEYVDIKNVKITRKQSRGVNCLFDDLKKKIN